MPAANGEKTRGNFWLYVWLGISGLLNLSGMASIVDGFVTWAQFFRDFIDTYRWAIRDPLSSIGNAIWPFGTIPGWVFDVFVVYSALFLAFNIFIYKRDRSTALGFIRTSYNQDGIIAAVFVTLATTVMLLFLPLLVLFFLTGVGFKDEVKRVLRTDARELVTNFGFIVALFILILLINWQLRNPGG